MEKEELQQRSLKFAVDIRQVALKVARQPTAHRTADQLVRAATSVGANYRSACRGRSRAEFIAKLGIVVEECDETVFWLEYIRDSSLMPVNEVSPLLDEAQQLRAIFAASYGTARRNNVTKPRRRR